MIIINQEGLAIFWNNNFIEYKTNGNKKNLSVKEYLKEIKSYLKYIINNFQKCDTWKIQLIFSINFFLF